jgi:hypothetical protein
MSREAHVRIYEGVGVKFPHATSTTEGFDTGDLKEAKALLKELE